MEYLNRVLGIRVFYLWETTASMPNFIHARYDLKKVTLDGQAAVFVYPKRQKNRPPVFSFRLSKETEEPSPCLIYDLKKVTLDGQAAVFVYPKRQKNRPPVFRTVSMAYPNDWGIRTWKIHGKG